MSCISFCGWLCESYEIKQKRDKQISDWIDVCKCNQDQIDEGKIYNGRMVKVYDENTVDILIKHTDRIEKYHMRLYDFSPIDKKNCCKLLQEISEETMGLCSVYIVSENKQKRIFYAIICDRFTKDIRTRLIDKGIMLEPSLPVSTSEEISSAAMKIKEHIIKKMDTLPMVIEENDVAVVLKRDEPEPEHEVISKEIAVAPVELLRKSITLPYIVEELKQDDSPPLQKKITIPFIVSEEVKVREDKVEMIQEEPVESKEEPDENPLRKSVTLPCIVEPDL
jgi:hypothetical protein